jgi:hypothetical protein
MTYTIIYDDQPGTTETGLAREDVVLSVDVPVSEVDWAIEQEGWCGTTRYQNDEKCIVVSDDTYEEWAEHGMPREAINYLFGKDYVV